MTEEEIKALEERAEEAERRADDAIALATRAAEERDKFKGDLTNVVEELKTVRKQRNEPLDKSNLSNTEPDVNELIEKALRERDENAKKTEFDRALAEFKSSKPEFQNDAAGIVYMKFEDGLKRFNFSDIGSKDQMKSRLEEVYQFLNFKPMNAQGEEYDGTPSGSSPVPVSPDQVSAPYKAAVEFSGIDAARAKTLQEKYPEAFDSLGLN